MFDKSLNSVTLIGNIGKNIDFKETVNGKLATFNIATTRSWKNKQTSERAEDTQWHNITVFGGLAGLCNEYLQKGCKVLVEGRLQTRRYTDNNKIERWVTSIVAGNIQLLSPAKDRDNNNETPSESAMNPEPDNIDFEDDVPF